MAEETKDAAPAKDSRYRVTRDFRGTYTVFIRLPDRIMNRITAWASSVIKPEHMKDASLEIDSRDIPILMGVPSIPGPTILGQLCDTLLGLNIELSFGETVCDSSQEESLWSGTYRTLYIPFNDIDSLRKLQVATIEAMTTHGEPAVMWHEPTFQPCIKIAKIHDAYIDMYVGHDLFVTSGWAGGVFYPEQAPTLTGIWMKKYQDETGPALSIGINLIDEPSHSTMSTPLADSAKTTTR